MGEQLTHEFSLSGVNTGRTTPSMQTTVNMPASPDMPDSGGPQQVSIPGQPVMRPSFLQAFLANLGPALAGGITPTEGHPTGGGIGGAIANIQSVGNQNRQYQLQVQAANRAQQQEASTLALQAQQLQQMKAEGPLEIQSKQIGVQQAQLGLQRAQALVQLAQTPGGVEQLVAPMSSSLGKLTPDEQAQLDAAKTEVQTNLKQGKFDVSPYNTAVQKISQDRITTQRGAEASPFKAWKQQFIAEKGREPTAKEIESFQMASRMMFAPENRIVQVADPNNPGNITYMKAGQAMKSGALAPQSAESQAAKAVTKSAVAGKIGEEINAFNTAIQHKDLLKTAVIALNNGDQTTINSIKNRLKTEFGISGPVTAQVIADAYTREVNKMLSSGHMTDSEIGAIGKTLNVNRQSLQQTLSALDAYGALAESKMKMRQQQVERGQKGQANFPTSGGQEIHYKIVNGQLVPQ